MGLHGRPGLLHSALSLTSGWWQQSWILLKRRDGVHRDVHQRLDRIWKLGLPASGDSPQLPSRQMPPAQQKGACLSLAAAQEAFEEVFMNLAVTAAYWVQTFGLNPSDVGLVTQLFDAAGIIDNVKCAGVFREYPSFANRGQIYKTEMFCPAPLHGRTGNVTRFCDGNMQKFANEISRAARFG
jgi:hypothetical protein